MVGGKTLSSELEAARQSFVDQHVFGGRGRVVRQRTRYSNTLESCSFDVAAWCAKNAESPELLNLRLNFAREFLIRLDNELHSELSPIETESHELWRHLDIAYFHQISAATERGKMVELNMRTSDLLDEYLSVPFLHSGYLDWLFLDLMTATKITGIGEPHIASEQSGLTKLWHKLSTALSRQPTYQRKMRQQIEALTSVYNVLAGPVLHVPTVRKAFNTTRKTEMIWDQRIFHILDNLAMRDQKK